MHTKMQQVPRSLCLAFFYGASGLQPLGLEPTPLNHCPVDPTRRLLAPIICQTCNGKQDKVGQKYYHHTKLDTEYIYCPPPPPPPTYVELVTQMDSLLRQKTHSNKECSLSLSVALSSICNSNSMKTNKACLF